METVAGFMLKLATNGSDVEFSDKDFSVYSPR